MQHALIADTMSCLGLCSSNIELHPLRPKCSSLSSTARCRQKSTRGTAKHSSEQLHPQSAQNVLSMSQLWHLWDSLQHWGTLRLPEPTVGVLQKPGMLNICFRLDLDKKSMRIILGTLRKNTCLLSCCRTGQMRRSITLSRAGSKLKGEFWDTWVPIFWFWNWSTRSTQLVAFDTQTTIAATL